jgi:hypothetical protein
MAEHPVTMANEAPEGNTCVSSDSRMSTPTAPLSRMGTKRYALTLRYASVLPVGLCCRSLMQDMDFAVVQQFNVCTTQNRSKEG